ncbi:signal transducer and activator of transcription 6 isoform X2 [Trichomycterus rosablanca]|uniref:signal transducer and activator of transcription 6 isoform X2 n=1 Tax=Trichomycterus rosablanca TaxID=2290929 RepID=UPI002F352158
MEEIDVDSLNQEGEARQLLEQMLILIHNLASQNSQVVEIVKFQQISKKMGTFWKQPLELVKIVRHTLRTERNLLQHLGIQQIQQIPQIPQMQPPTNNTPKPCKEVNNDDVSELMTKVQQIQNIRKKIQHYQEDLNWETEGSEQGQNEVDPEQIAKKNRIAQMEREYEYYTRKRVEGLRMTICDLEQSQSRLIERIYSWRWEQLRSTIGYEFDENLLPLQTQCQQLFEVNVNLRQELMLLKRDFGTDEKVHPLIENLNCLLQTLIHSSLVVEKQPPQVIKTQSKFSSSVRYLLGEKVAPGKPVVLKAQIITESQARVNAQTENVGELINNNAILEHNTASRNTCATFRNMSIKKIKRADRKGSESVTEEKFAILFTTQITVPGCDILFPIQVITLPVVIIVHGSQENNAVATIIWDCAFSEPNRIPFVVPDRVPWRQMCEALNHKFMSEVQTRRGLDDNNFLCLAQKIFDKPDMSDFSNAPVSWAQFNKEVLPGRNFTFWQWFEGVIELTKKCLKQYWSSGLIFGFIGKQYLHVILQDKPCGTFLLRYSDSEIGGITIAYVGQSENGCRKILNVQPFNKKDLDSVGLGDRVRDINCISHLYPHYPKYDKFSGFYTVQPATNPDGYIPFKLTTVVNQDSGQSVSSQPEISFESYPMNTESIYSVHPPVYAPTYPVDSHMPDQGSFANFGYNEAADAPSNMELDDLVKILST